MTLTTLISFLLARKPVALLLHLVLLGLVCALVSCFGGIGFSSQAAAAAIEANANDQIQVRMRISWGGGTSEKWAGSIRFHDAAIDDAAVLGMNVESPAGIQFQDHGIRIKQLVDSDFEGLDVRVSGEAGSRVTFQLSADGKPTVEQQFTLSDAMDQPQVFRLDESSNRISFQRLSWDRIKNKTTRSDMVFNVGETFEFQVGANRVDGASSSTKCTIRTTEVESKATVSQTTIALPCDANGRSDWVRHVVAVPADEGVYDIEFTLENDDELGLLSKRKPIAQRTIQIVALGQQPFANDSISRWQTVLELSPNDLRPQIVQSVNQLTRLVGVADRTATVGKFSIQNQTDPIVSLPPGGWQAVSLKISDPNAKHLVEIDYDGGQAMSLGCSVLPQNAAASLTNFGFDSGFAVSELASASTTSGLATHRMTFWPDSNRVVLLLANRDDKSTAEFKKIRLRKLEPSMASSTAPVAASATGSTTDRRGMMALYEQPLFAENFGVANRSDGSSSGQPIADWTTYYRGAKRLISHLRDINSSGALINVLGEGSSLVPLKSMSSSPRYDTGVFSEVGKDVVKKDVVQLLYRMFEREGLRLVPMLTFDHPISNLEFAANEESKLVDYRNAERTAVEYELPKYNPLSRDVQSHVNSVVREFVDRYKNQAGYEGLAIVCRPDTCTLLPGSRVGGYDQPTVSRFMQEVGLVGPVLDGSELFSEGNMQRWLSWRCAAMTKWYEQIARICSSGDRRAQCYLATIDIARNEEFGSVLSPALHHTPDFDQAMFRMGLSPQLSDRRNGIVVMQPHRHAPLHSLASQRSEFDLPHLRQFDQWFDDQFRSATLLYSRSAWARFENLEKSSLLNRNRGPILRLQQLSRSGRWACQPWARALLENDSKMLVDGGLVMSTSVNDYRKSFAGVLSKLTDKNFKSASHTTHPKERHPVAVRYLEDEDSTQLYLVNSSPWQVVVDVKASQTIGTNFESFDHRNWISEEASPGPRSFRVVLQPFELVGGRVANASVMLEEFSYQLPEAAQRQMSASYYKLRSKLVSAGNAKPLNWLENPGFEKQTLDNWTMGNQSHSFATVRADTNSREGRCCLKMKNAEQLNAWIRSEAFPVSETGRLSISVWLKLAVGAEQPPLRISVESDDPKTDYYRFAEVGSLHSIGGAENQLTSEWRQFAVHFDDLPQQPISGLRIGFDLIGPGEVWVDQVEIFDRWLDENDAKAITQMLASIGPLLNETEAFERCRTVLESYWPTFLQEHFEDLATARESDVSPIAEVQKPVRSTMRQKFRRFVSPGIFQFR